MGGGCGKQVKEDGIAIAWRVCLLHSLPSCFEVGEPRLGSGSLDELVALAVGPDQVGAEASLIDSAPGSASVASDAAAGA